MSTSEQSGDPRIVLGCPMLKPQQKFINALLKLVRENIFEGYVFPDVSLLPHARNTICTIAYEKHPDFTHLLFIDDDMTFTMSDVLKLYQANKPVVSGLAVTRKPPHRIVASLNPAQFPQYVKDESVISVPHLGMAFTLIDRQTLDDTRQEHDVWFTMDREPRLMFNDEWEEKRLELENPGTPLPTRLQAAMEFGQDAHLNSKLLGEDIAFSKLCQKLGIPLHVHCGVLLGHIGDKSYDITHAADTPAIVTP